MTHASVLHSVIFFCAGALAAAVVRADDAPRLAALLAAGGAVTIPPGDYRLDGAAPIPLL